MDSATFNPSGLSLIFAAGSRPAASAIARLAEGAPGTAPFALTHADADAGWVELLSAGLAFDLVGLAPAPAERPPLVEHRYGLGAEALAGEAVLLSPGPHLLAGANLLPVVRVMAGIAMALAALPGVLAVCWHPARSAIAPAAFHQLVAAWLAGGAFPAPGLVALAPQPDGGLRTAGMSYFTGQELSIEPLPQQTPAQIAKLAVRLIHRLVESEAVMTPGAFTGPEGERLHAEPSEGGRLLKIWRTDGHRPI